MYKKFSWKGKRTCIQITPKGTTKESRDWFCRSRMFSWQKRINLSKTFRGKILKQKRKKKKQIKTSFKSCSYNCQFNEVLNPKTKASEDEWSKFKENKNTKFYEIHLSFLRYLNTFCPKLEKNSASVQNWKIKNWDIHSLLPNKK